VAHLFEVAAGGLSEVIDQAKSVIERELAASLDKEGFLSLSRHLNRILDDVVFKRTLGIYVGSLSLVELEVRDLNLVVRNCERVAEETTLFCEATARSYRALGLEAEKREKKPQL